MRRDIKKLNSKNVSWDRINTKIYGFISKQSSTYKQSSKQYPLRLACEVNQAFKQTSKRLQASCLLTTLDAKTIEVVAKAFLRQREIIVAVGRGRASAIVLRWVFRNDLCRWVSRIGLGIDFDFWPCQIKHLKSKSSQIQLVKVKVKSSQIRS